MTAAPNPETTTTASAVWTIARKELRAAFASPVAFIFMATFLVATLFTFFWVEPFFARNLSDVRPLLDWLPVLLILLVSALSMRQWSEEHKQGTVEVLMTLPVPTHALVLGKFTAGLTLVALALAMTLGLPITVSMMGDLDWGPVFGGYLAALLLAAAYLAVGLLVSATTSSQIVALLGTAGVCCLLYLPGSDAITSLVSDETAAILRKLGTGSRFESVARGVLDLRDLVYYLSLTGAFLVGNVAVLSALRASSSAKARPRRIAHQAAAWLAVGNFLAINLWMAPVGVARIDLTERGEYSLSPVTHDLLASLDEPLVIRAYISDRTHPLLAPLSPQLRDRLAEYEAVGGANVSVEFIDPRTDEDAEREAHERYGIEPVPFRVADRHEDALVNAYFHVLVQYGDQHEVLSFDDLIEVKVSGLDDVEVRLRNLEYDVTRTIKKAVTKFQSNDTLFASLPGEVVLRAYISEQGLPEEYAEVRERLEKVSEALKVDAGDRLSLRIEDPTSETQQRALFERYGLRPYAVSPLSDTTFYMHLLVEVGDQVFRISPSAGMSEADLREAILDTLQRAVPGFIKTVGLVAPQASPPPGMPGQPPMPPMGDNEGTFGMLREQLSQTYEVELLDLASAEVPGHIDALLVVAPSDLDEKVSFAIDQYLMRGGPTIVLGGEYAAADLRRLDVTKRDTGLEDQLTHYGVRIEDKLVLDPRNTPIPVPVRRDIGGGLVVEEMHALPYPFFVDVRPDQMAEGDLRVRGLAGVSLHWSSPVRLVEHPQGLLAGDLEGREATVLLESSAKSWTQSNTDTTPQLSASGDTGFAPPADATREQRPLAVAIDGRFGSFFADSGGPGESDDPEGDQSEAADPDEEDSREQHVIERSPEHSRLVVVGSASFVRDDILRLSRQLGDERYADNLAFVQNLVDWAVADTDLLSIRTGGSYSRTLDVDSDERRRWEWINYGLVGIWLFGVAAITYRRRRSERPMELIK